MQHRIASVLAISACFLGISAAQAGELNYPPPLDTTSTLTRAEVRQALQEARANGEIFSGELDPATLSFEHTGSSATRSQVVQELEQARAQGSISRGNLDYPPTQG